MKIRAPISFERRTMFGFLSVVIMCAAYSFLSYRQHERNPKDTTVPNLPQMVQGIKTATTPDRKVSFPQYCKIRFLENVPFYHFDKVGYVSNLIDREIVPYQVESYIGTIWLWEDFKATYSRLAIGLLIGIIASIVWGILMGHFTWFDAFSNPPLSFFGFVPATAALAVFFAICGTGDMLYTSVIVFGVFPTLSRSIYLAAAKDVEEQEIDKFLTLGSSTFEVIYELSFKKILPRILGSIRLVIGPTMISLIAVEWAMSDVGFGYRLKIQSRLLNMNICYFYCLFLGFFGLFLDFVIVRVKQWLCAWFDD